MLRDPLFHFILAGALLFAGASFLESLRKPVVRLTQADIDQLAAVWEAQSFRKPTEEEMRGLIQERIDEEVLAQEAHKLGLDDGDIIIRRRLAQKMAFISDDLAVMTEPSPEQLRAFFDAHRDEFAMSERISFRHVVFSADRPGDSEQAAADAVLAAAKKGATPIGDPSLAPATFVGADPRRIAEEFGAPFAELVGSAAVGDWAGPVSSPFGVHLVRVERRDQRTEAAFEQVEGQVRESYLAAERERLNRDLRDEVRSRYRVEVNGEAWLP